MLHVGIHVPYAVPFGAYLAVTHADDPGSETG